MFVQLMKTTPYLSGQHRLDVCLKKESLRNKSGEKLDKNNWTIVTGDCHLSPLSENIPFTDSIERNFFSQTYGDNLKVLYSQLKDDFFRDIPQIKSQNILYEESTNSDAYSWIDTTDHTYECGMRRLRFQKYGKQFSWLCPLWIENSNLINGLFFIMTITGDTAKKHTMKLKIDLSEELKKSLIEWLNGISSDLLYIDIDKERATITGANPEFGTPVTCDVSYIVPQLIDRERPIMETNSTLNQLFSSNNIIARQLINFNFCFSPEDVIPSHIIQEFYGHRWKVIVDAYYNNEQLDKVDFLSNYEELPSYVIENSSGSIKSKPNVFSYLDDNQYIDYMYINKTTQVDPYWSLVENPDYIYNFYNGFSSWYLTDEGFKQTMGLTMNQPDVEHDDFYEQYNNIGWCEIYDYTHTTWSTETLILLEQNYRHNGHKCTHIKYGPGKVTWINGLKFDCTYEDPTAFPSGNFKLIMCLTGDDPAGQMNIKVIKIGEGDDELYCIIVPSGHENTDNSLKNKLTVKSLITQVPNMNGDGDVVQAISNFFHSVMPKIIWPTKIIFKKSIQPIKADSPDADTTEIEYIKQEYNNKSYIFRYSGAIRPYFIPTDSMYYYNIDYHFKKWSNSELENPEAVRALKEYNDNLNRGYNPNYPSIGFYALEKSDRIEYFDYPERYNNILYEFQWYMDGRFYVLPQELNLQFTVGTSQNINEEYLKAVLSNKLSMYGILNNVALYQLVNFYDYKVDYSYISDTDISQQLFKVKYTLR